MKKLFNRALGEGPSSGTDLDAEKYQTTLETRRNRPGVAFLKSASENEIFLVSWIFFRECEFQKWV